MDKVVVVLLTSDNKMLEVDLDVAKPSNYIKAMIDLGYRKYENAEVIPLLDVDEPTLKLVIEWLTQNQNDGVLEVEKVGAGSVAKFGAVATLSESEAQFMDRFDMETVKKLVMAASFLEINALMDLCCKTMAIKGIKGKTAEQIRTIFGLQRDHTPEREKEIKKENALIKKAANSNSIM